jgi:hypothetical protein
MMEYVAALVLKGFIALLTAVAVFFSKWNCSRHFRSLNRILDACMDMDPIECRTLLRRGRHINIRSGSKLAPAAARCRCSA